MAIDLRPHQSLGMSLIREAFGQYRRVLFVAPMAFGKTVTFSAISASATQLGRRIVIIAHRQDLIDQISRTLAWVDVDHGVISRSEEHTSEIQSHMRISYAVFS